MEKFKDIKVGDEVLVCVGITYGWGKSKTFYLARKVERITKTQFVIGSHRFKKDTGQEIGGYGEVRYVGEPNRWSDGVVYVDQTMEYNQFKIKITAMNACNSLMGRTDRWRVSIHDNSDDIANLHKLMEQVASTYAKIKEARDVD